MHVFGYGSLLLPESLSRNLPGIGPADCVPACCTGMRRAFDVAFPNDGSQPDKAYFEPSGRRPPAVLFANLRQGAGAVNGICIPVDAGQLDRLAGRELRYEIHDLTTLVTAYPCCVPPRGPVLAFLGRSRFTRADDAARAVVAKSYLACLVRGARFWESRQPGFWSDFQASTDHPAHARTADLRRVDNPLAGQVRSGSPTQPDRN